MKSSFMFREILGKLVTNKENKQQTLSVTDAGERKHSSKAAEAICNCNETLYPMKERFLEKLISDNKFVTGA